MGIFSKNPRISFPVNMSPKVNLKKGNLIVIECSIFEKESQVLTNEKRDNSTFSLLIG